MPRYELSDEESLKVTRYSSEIRALSLLTESLEAEASMLEADISFEDSRIEMLKNRLAIRKEESGNVTAYIKELRDELNKVVCGIFSRLDKPVPDSAEFSIDTDESGNAVAISEAETKE